ncbi:MAG: His/Gly/Thr/Pro-type tRNA ligase C-terminal domain-containing protein, partial [Actinomycetota bacterium]|nr:His/Gly/Thr/Pro-type tRNA ligase C-terminal domain-containing protein [Actinomycetota bacterium]
QRLRDAGVRTEVDDSTDTIGAKIRRQQLQKVPYMLVVGDEEAEAETVSLRRRSGDETRGVPVTQLVDGIAEEIRERRVEPSL